MALIAEGTKKTFKGREYILQNSRWRRASDGQDLKTKFKPLNEDKEEDRIASATRERLNQLQKKYEALLERLEEEPTPFADPDDHPFARDIDTLNSLISSAENRRGELDIEDEAEEADDDGFYRGIWQKHTVKRNSKDHLVITREEQRFPRDDGGVVILSPRTRTIGKDKATDTWMVQDTAMSRTFLDKDGTVTKHEPEYMPAEFNPARERVLADLIFRNDPTNGEELLEFLRLSNSGKWVFSAPEEGTIGPSFKSPDQLPFQKAIDYFAQKTNLDTDDWTEGQGITQQVAFTVAGAKGSLLQDFRDAVEAAIKNGTSTADFAIEFRKIAAQYSSSWGDKTPARAQLIYSQNLRQAYAAGRYAQMTEPETLKRRPYWQWRHGGTREPRPVHLAMDNRVFKADSLPFYPPSGFNCACQVHSLSQRDIDREGLVVEDLKLGQEIEWEGQSLKLEPDKGFNWKPGGNREQTIERLDPDLRAAIKKEAKKNDPKK
jgi:hypothetical protein